MAKRPSSFSPLAPAEAASPRRRVSFSLLPSAFCLLPLLVPAQDAPTSGTLSLSTEKTPFLENIIRTDWATHSIWDDGNAEVATYDGERIVDGEARPHTLRLITVKEDLNKEFWAKADWPPGDKPILQALRQSQLATIPAQHYDHQYMVTLFYERGNIGNAVKMIASSQEWAGATFKEFQLYERPPRLVQSSYWDGEGTRTIPLPDHRSNTFFEEELPLLVRALPFEEGLVARFAMQPNQTTNHAAEPRPISTQLTVARPLTRVTTIAGEWDAEQLWRVDIESLDARSAAFWVADDPVNTLVRFEWSDGRVYELSGTRRWRYWER